MPKVCVCLAGFGFSALAAVEATGRTNGGEGCSVWPRSGEKGSGRSGNPEDGCRLSIENGDIINGEGR